ncbi:MAG: protein translocase subunit SecD [Acidimicrobiia bacterium]
MRRNVFYLVTTVVVVLGALAATIVAGKSPVLGLDLQGGVSVRLVPVGDPSSGSLDVAVDIIRNRVDALGVSEAEVTREGGDVVVNLPGVKDRDKAQRLVGRTAELQFRPVLTFVGDASTPATTTAADPAATTVPVDENAAKLAIASCDPTQVQAIPPDQLPSTRRAEFENARAEREACVLFPATEDAEGPAARYYLGPTAMTGADTGGADAEFQQGQGYSVVLELEDTGRDKFNTLAGESFPKPPPQNSVAIVLDGVVQSAPAFQEPEFNTDVSITGNFSRTEAEDLARLLQYGALPVRFDESQQTVENVSPTLGNDQLRAGVTAGLIGIALVAIYMFLYYRILALVVLSGLALTAAGTYALVSYLGDTVGLALTLAGVTGLIVSVGVTVDSYIVYFERLKDEVRSGKTVRSSVDRGFKSSFRTILAADLVSLIGAAVLYLLAIGSVRGFAFFLGLATLLDLGVTYFFMHPLVVLIARRPGLLRARYVGIASGLDAAEVTA